MEDFITYLGIFIAAVVVLLGIVTLGFRIRPRVKSPVLTRRGSAAGQAPLRSDLPAPVKRWLDVTSAKVKPPASAMAWGYGRIAVSKLPLKTTLWSPLAWTLYLEPGEGFVCRTRLAWFRRVYLRGGDEYREGKGRFMMGGRAMQTEALDRSERTMLWLYSLYAAPLAVAAIPQLRWQGTGDHSALLEVPCAPDQFWSFNLTFDEQSGCLERVETLRTASRDGSDLPFQVYLEGALTCMDGVVLPARLRAAWEGEVYLELTLSGAAYQVDVRQELREGIDENEPAPPSSSEEVDAAQDH